MVSFIYMKQVCGFLSKAFSWGSFNPKETQEEQIYNSDKASSWPIGKKDLKIMTWNVQYFAGTKQRFWWEGGKDSSVTQENIDLTMPEIASIIADEDPDVIFLQELDNGAKRTRYARQIKELLKLLPEHYCCYAETFYWKHKFIPLPKVFGSVGLTMVTISKYKMSNGIRHQLSFDPYTTNPVVKNFVMKKACLETSLTIGENQQIKLFNVHLSSFSRDSTLSSVNLDFDAKTDELQKLDKILAGIQAPWVLAGDFNVLPPNFPLEKVEPFFRGEYHTDSYPILALLKKYPNVFSPDELVGKGCEKYYTIIEKVSGTKKPNRTLDYVFHHPILKKKSAYTRWHGDVALLSDHCPVIAIFELQ